MEGALDHLGSTLRCDTVAVGYKRWCQVFSIQNKAWAEGVGFKALGASGSALNKDTAQPSRGSTRANSRDHSETCLQLEVARIYCVKHAGTWLFRRVLDLFAHERCTYNTQDGPVSLIAFETLFYLRTASGFKLCFQR